MGDTRSNEARFPLYLQILTAMIGGGLLGWALGERATPLGELGKIVITLIKGVATPLLFLAVINAILKTEVESKGAVRMLVAAAINACFAMTIGLLVSNVLQPGKHLHTLGTALADPNAQATYAGKKVDLTNTLLGFVPSNVVTPFSENIVLSIILLALLLGFGIRRARKEQEAAGNRAYRALEDGLETMLSAVEIVLGWVVKLIPLAVLGVVAKAVGEHGLEPFKGLGVYVAVGLLGLLLHVLIVYHGWLIFVLRIPVRKFWREAREPVSYALGANSSLATLPVTLRALDRLGVSRASSTLGACVGTNFNNDGIILYEGMAVLFVAQASGIDLSLGQQLLAASICMIAAMGVAGVPEAGFISLALVLNTVGLPIELLPLLLTVDWLVARGRSATNVLSDMLLSLIIDRKSRKSPMASAEQPAP